MAILQFFVLFFCRWSYCRDA